MLMRRLNMITIKNKHPLPLIRILMDFFASAKCYTKLDIIAAYNALRVCKNDK